MREALNKSEREKTAAKRKETLDRILLNGRKCTKCGETKPISEFAKVSEKLGQRRSGYRTKCKPCRNVARRTYAARYRDRVRAGYNKWARQVGRAKLREKERRYIERVKVERPEVYEAWRQKNINDRRARRQRAGAKPLHLYKEQLERERLERDGDALAMANACDAWNYWKKVKAPDLWMEAYYEASGKPWNNPRLSVADKYRIRYQRDEVFRVIQVRKQDLKRDVRGQRIAKNNDGTLSKDALTKLYREAKRCPYCGIRMKWKDKSLDHLVPISL